MVFAVTPLGRPTPPTPDAPEIYSDRYKHSIVDSKFQPEMGLLSTVKGTPRLAEWYRNRLERDEEPFPYGPGNVGTYQSYERIKDVVLKLDGNPSFSFDAESGESTEEFECWVINGLVPGKFNLFIMDIGDGNAGLFTVTEQPVLPRITANKVYKLQVKFLAILNKDDYEILDSRVVKEFVYSRELSLRGSNPVITPEHFNIGKKLFEWQCTISNYLMREWYWNPEKTIGFQNEQDEWVYDPYLTNFICAVLPPDMRTTYPFINQFSVQYGGLQRGHHGTINVWEVLLRGDVNLLKVCNNKAALIQTNRIANSRLYGNLRSSKFRWFICTNPEDFKNFISFYNGDGYPVLLAGVSKEFSGYLFSPEFYTGHPVEPFEKMLFNALSKRFLDKEALLKYCEGYFDLLPRVQLYHGAILLMLLQLSRELGDPL